MCSQRLLLILTTLTITFLHETSGTECPEAEESCEAVAMEPEHASAMLQVNAKSPHKAVVEEEGKVHPSKAANAKAHRQLAKKRMTPQIGKHSESVVASEADLHRRARPAKASHDQTSSEQEFTDVVDEPRIEKIGKKIVYQDLNATNTMSVGRPAGDVAYATSEDAESQLAQQLSEAQRELQDAKDNRRTLLQGLSEKQAKAADRKETDRHSSGSDVKVADSHPKPSTKRHSVEHQPSHVEEKPSRASEMLAQLREEGEERVASSAWMQAAPERMEFKSQNTWVMKSDDDDEEKHVSEGSHHMSAGKSSTSNESSKKATLRDDEDDIQLKSQSAWVMRSNDEDEGEEISEDSQREPRADSRTGKKSPRESSVKKSSESSTSAKAGSKNSRKKASKASKHTVADAKHGKKSSPKKKKKSFTLSTKAGKRHRKKPSMKIALKDSTSSKDSKEDSRHKRKSSVEKLLKNPASAKPKRRKAKKSSMKKPRVAKPDAKKVTKHDREEETFEELKPQEILTGVHTEKKKDKTKGEVSSKRMSSEAERHGQHKLSAKTASESSEASMRAKKEMAHVSKTSWRAPGTSHKKKKTGPHFD